MSASTAGVAIGLWIGLLVWGTLASVVAGLPAWDAPEALAGALPPAWRAARTAPTTLVSAAD